MPLRNLLASTILRKGRTLKIELREFKDLFNMNEEISVAGYHKQRMKLNPLALKDLAQYHAKQFYADDEAVKTLKGFLIVAGDGVYFNVPAESKNFANSSNKGATKRPQAFAHCTHDVLNRVMIDLDVNTHRINDRNVAIAQAKNVPNIVGDKPCIYTYDRGYPSGEFLLDCKDEGKLFVIRIPKTLFAREQESMTSDDCEVEIIFDKKRISRNSKTAERLKKAKKINARFVRIKLPTGEHEYLATNISSEMFNTTEIGEIYRLRWGIETVFDDFKNKLGIENFTGTKQVIIEQDIYATMYLLNISSDIMQSAEVAEGYKYKMQLNRNMSFGIIKSELIHLILSRDMNEKQQRMATIVQEIERNLLPVRPNRSYERKKLIASKHHNTRKRCY